MREITVVIPNWNGKKYLTSCLQSLYENAEVELDIIVVDNGSTDGSIESAKEAYPGVKYILLDKNHGFSKAVNEGIENSETPYVLLLNNDTKIKKGFIKSLLQTIKSDSKIFSVEAKMIQYNHPEKIDSAGTFYNALGWAFARGNGKSSSKYNELCETFAACAGAALYRKQIMEEIGLFEEKFFAYLEDIDIGYRAKLHGYKNVYEPKAIVYHVGSASSGTKHNAFKVRLSARNNIYLIYRNMPWIQILLNLPCFIIGFGIKTLFFAKKKLAGDYLSGIREGYLFCKRNEKPKFYGVKWFDYARIQFELWKNVGKKRW